MLGRVDDSEGATTSTAFFFKSKLRMCTMRIQVNSYFLGSHSLNNPMPINFYSAWDDWRTGKKKYLKDLWTNWTRYVCCNPTQKNLVKGIEFQLQKKRKNFIETCIIFPIWYSYIHRTSQLHLACTNQNIFQLFSTFDPLSL